VIVVLPSTPLPVENLLPFDKIPARVEDVMERHPIEETTISIIEEIKVQIFKYY